MEVELSVGLMPGNKNKYIVVEHSTGKELIINGGVTLKVIDENGELHKLGCILSADYFFKVVTNGLDEDHQKSPFNIPFECWGVGSKFSSKSLEEERKKAWEQFLKNPNG